MPRRYTPPELVDSFSKLSSLPEVYLKIRDKLQSSTTTLAGIADTINADPAITARLLKVVNSPLYGMSRRVETVSRAVSVLGLQQVHDIVLASSVTSAFSGIPITLMNVRRHWTLSLITALAARALGRKAGLVDNDRLFVVGLLSRVGHLVMYDKIPQLASVALSHAERNDQPLYVIERQLIGCDYAAVGAELLDRWLLPTNIVAMIRDHVEPEQAQASAIGAAVVHIGMKVALAQAANVGKIQVDAFDPYLWEATGLNPGIVLEIDQQVRGEFDAALEVFMPSLAQAA